MKIRVVVRSGKPDSGSPYATELSIGEGSTVNDLIGAMSLDSGEVWLGLVSGRLVDMDHYLQDGDELTLVPPVAGGC